MGIWIELINQQIFFGAETRSVFMSRSRMGSIACLLLLGLLVALFAQLVAPGLAQNAGTQTPPVSLTAQQDHQRIMDLLHIATLRGGADGNHPDAPNAANYDEAKANPYPDLPNPLVLKNGKNVKTSETWWHERRPELVEDFDREIYGRVPRNTPKVNWEVTSTAEEKNGEFAVI